MQKIVKKNIEKYRKNIEKCKKNIEKCKNGEEAWPVYLSRTFSNFISTVVVALIKRKTTDFVCGLKIYSLN